MRVELLGRAVFAQRERFRALSRVWVHFAPYVARERSTLVGAVLCGAGAAGMLLARPWALKVVFDHVIGKHPYKGWLKPLAGLPATTVVALIAVTYLLMVFIGGVCMYWQEVWTAQAGHHVVFGLRKKLFNHLVGLSLGFHRRRRAGDLIMHLTGDIQLLKDMIVDGAVLVTSQTLVVIGMLAITLLVDPVLASLSLLVIPLLALASVRISRGIRQAVKHQRLKESHLASTAGETLSAIALIQAFGRERAHTDDFAAQNNASLKQGLKTTRLEAVLGRLADMAAACGICVVLWVGTLRSARGLITPGDLIVFLSYLTVVYRPIRRIARVTSRSAKAMVCAERLADLLETDLKVVEWKDAVPAPRFAGRISIRGVRYTYPGARRAALDDVSLEVEPGEVLALAGSIGAGKTTLAMLLVRLFDPDEGRVRIDGEDVRRYTLESLRSRIAVVPQDPLLFHASVHDNIAYGEPGASRAQVEAAARAVGAHDFVEKLADGYDTVLGEKGATLSSGQRQLLALARALCKDAPIVILDEPTANLDAVSRETVREALAVLLAGRTALVITHTLIEALGADRVVILRKGEVIEQGRPAELSRQGGWFQQALAAQMLPLVPSREAS